MKLFNIIFEFFAIGIKDSAWGKYIVKISIVITIFILGGFLGFYIRNRNLMQDILITKGRSHFHNILLTRKWNSGYGGVFVEKKKGVESNPYLENPDIITRDGIVYTKKNPALMTREISKLATDDKMFTFHLTSTNPLNPGNKPDKFEFDALRSFEKGNKETFGYENENGQEHFRYMAPLFVEESCLQCHRKQGYKVGDVRGGISVKYDITDIRSSMLKSNILIFCSGILSLAGILWLLIYFNMKLKTKLNEAQEKLEELATIDPLTDLANRRRFFSILESEISRIQRYGGCLGVIMVDIDHFKRINDSFGHPAGDFILKSVANTLKDNTRETDIVSRFGGEEFMVLAPNTNLEGTSRMAENLRIRIEESVYKKVETLKITVTASFGVTAIESLENGVKLCSDVLVSLSDKALYQAKREGRNKVIAVEFDPKECISVCCQK